MNLQSQDRLHIQQKLSLSLKKYQVFLDDTGKPGDLVAYVEEDKKAFKDKVDIYTGEDKSEVLAEVKAHKLLDPAAGFDVTTPDGDPIGGFKKQVGKSLLQSTWTLQPAGAPPITVIERNKTIAICRRLWMLLPVVGEFPFPMRYHFEFNREGKGIGGVDKTHMLSDNYLAWIEDPNLDRRLLVAIGIAVDFRQSR
jgi:hypothetical protein